MTTIPKLAVNSVDDVLRLAGKGATDVAKTSMSKTATLANKAGQINFVQYVKGHGLTSQTRAALANGDIFIRSVAENGEITQNLIQNGKTTRFAGSKEAIEKGVKVFNEFFQKIINAGK